MIVLHGVTMTTTVSVRLPDEIALRLDDVAGLTDRSKSYLIKRAIEQYLEEYADLQIAYDRMHDVSEKSISSAEMRELLAD